MFTNYLKITFRNLWKYKVYSFINITGLAIGMACFLLFLFYVRFEKSYDNFHANGDRIYRVIKESVSEGRAERRAMTGAPVATRLMQEFPAIANAVRFTNFFEGLVCANEKCFNMGAPIGDYGIRFISFFLIILAGLILFTACINFMNLTTARSTTRAREIGVRKVLGANRYRLVKQFLGESLLYSFLALILAMVLVELARPAFQTLVGNAFPTFNLLPKRQIDIPYIQNFGSVLITALIVGAISGIYPAFVLSGFQAAQVIKGEARSGRSSACFRKSLVVGQFAASTVLIISSLVILR